MSTETPLELKKTVNLPKTNFGQKANLGQTEPARLKKWSEMNLYALIRASRRDAEKFILHDGPPYANADIHLGTAMNKILKDIVVKSRTMLGYDAPYVPGYDCHGLPIEQHVERALDAKGKKKNDLSVESFRRACREHASNALKGQTRDFKRLGILGLWENPYTTMSKQYEAETARLFGTFAERNYVYKGARPVYWCIHDQTALAEAEVEYREHTSPSVYVKFEMVSDPDDISKGAGEKLAGHRTYFVIWTTTPWTLPANMAIAVHPSYVYAVVEHGDEAYVVAKELVNDFAKKVGIEEPVILVEFTGEELKRGEAKYRHPWIERVSPVILGEHVTMGGEADAETELDVSEAREKQSTGKAGTGLVHTAPGHGHDDFVVGRANNLDVYCPVDNAGRFTSEVEHFAGQSVFEANAKIVEFMRERGVLLFSEDYQHRYPHCWRCKNPVIFRATPQWFIALNEERQDAQTGEMAEPLNAGAIREIQKVKWVPAWGRERMLNMFKDRADWCVSRQRVWGVPIPAFYCLDCNGENPNARPLLDKDVINHVADIFEKESADAWFAREASELLPEGYRCPECGGSKWSKETDILDVWFDSGSSWSAVFKEYFAGELKEWRAADVYLEGGDQYRGWFNSSLLVSLTKYKEAPYRAVVTHGWTLDAQGHAMHKSAGNAIAPEEFVKDSGADILRLWVISSDFKEDMRCSAEILQRVSEGYRKLRNTARFALGNLAGFDPARDSITENEMQEVDRWALAELDAVTAKVLAGYEAYEFHTVFHTLYNFATVTLSARYFDIIKDRLYTAAPHSNERRSAQTALYRIADALARLLAPILVFTADEIWENLPRSSGGDNTREPAVHIALFPAAAGERDAELLARWARLFEVREEVLQALEKERIAKVIGSSLEARVEISATGETYELLKSYREQLRYLFIVSQVDLIELSDAESSQSSNSFHVSGVEHAAGEKCERCWNYSTRVGESTRYPTACERCTIALAEIEEEGVGA
jgi:isoleucyl-tRNA synthetase